MTTYKKPINLTLYSEFDFENQVIFEDVSLEKVLSIVDKTDWTKFHQIILNRGQHNWIEVSGNIKDDGLAGLYFEEDDLFITNEAPKNVETLKEMLISFYKNDGIFQQKFNFENQTGNKERKEKEQEKYLKWKQNQPVNPPKKIAPHIKRFGIGILVMLFLSVLGKYWYEDELQFIGYSTEVTQAKIVETKMYHWGKGLYYQNVTYAFEFEGETYQGQFKAGKLKGKQFVGDFIKVKFAKNNPKKSKLIAFY